jgi:hypothetical protein
MDEPVAGLWPLRHLHRPRCCDNVHLYPTQQTIRPRPSPALFEVLPAPLEPPPLDSGRRGNGAAVPQEPVVVGNVDEKLILFAFFGNTLTISIARKGNGRGVAIRLFCRIRAGL